MEIGKMKWGVIAAMQLMTRSEKGRLNVQLIPGENGWLITVSEIDEEDFARLSDPEADVTVSAAKRVSKRGGRVLGIIESLPKAIEEAERFANDWLISEED